MSEPIKLSKTRLNSFITCPYKYFLGYGLNLRPQKKDLKLALGLATHKAIEEYLLHGQRHREDELCDLVAEAWSEFTPANTECESEEEIHQAREICLSLVHTFIQEVDLQPRMIEHSFSLPVVNFDTGEELEGVVWTGRTDFVDDRSCGSYVVDIKTKNKIGSFFDVRTSLELTGYAYIFRMEIGEEEAGVSLINLVKTKVTKAQRLNDTRDMADFIRFFSTIKAVVASMKDGRFYQNPGLHCSYCDYWPFCAGNHTLVIKRFGEEGFKLWQEARGGWGI